jgi:hypothetical protein
MTTLSIGGNFYQGGKGREERKKGGNKNWRRIVEISE